MIAKKTVRAQLCNVAITEDNLKTMMTDFLMIDLGEITMSISNADFEKMYTEAVKKCNADKKKVDIDSLLKWGGKDKLKEVLFDSEQILAVTSADEYRDGIKDHVLQSLLTSNALILTNMRLIFMSKKLFGTTVKDIALKQFSRIEWIEEYVFKFEDFKVISGEKELKIIKEMIYQMM